MKCSRCDYDNPNQANYCNNCGHKLSLDGHAGNTNAKASPRKSHKNVSEDGNTKLNIISKILVAASVAIMIFMSCVLIMVVLNGSEKTNGEAASIEYLTSSEKTQSKSKSSSKNSASSKASSKSSSKSSGKSSSDEYDDLTDDEYDDIYNYPYPDHIIKEY